MTKYKCKQCGKEVEAETAPQCCNATMEQVQAQQTEQAPSPPVPQPPKPDAPPATGEKPQ